MKTTDNGSSEKKEQIRARYKGINKSELTVIPAKEKTKLFEDTKTKRVAAYCRVSTDDVKQTSSYELQKNHYEDMIKDHVGWELVGIYADEGISGTSLEHRVEFNRMIKDCLAGKIDLIVTKSVSRFARNIVDCIDKQRMLANLNPPVGVFFETEHIYSLDSTSEMMMAVLAAAAQEESHTKSEIMNISIEQRFSRGIFLTPQLLGYDLDENGNLVVNEEEAETVRLCFYMCVCGFPLSEIAEILTELKRKTKRGNTQWSYASVLTILQNERHCGDVLSRKTFTPNYLDHKSKKNNHDRNQYMQKNHHEAIVSRDVYEAARKVLRMNRSKGKEFLFPKLQVIKNGLLNGFVPIDFTWEGYDIEDYREASLSVCQEPEQGKSDKRITAGNAQQTDEKQQTDDKRQTDDERQADGNSGSGFQLVRGQFFDMFSGCVMTISKNQIRFNKTCIEKFGDQETVSILFSVLKNQIAVIPHQPGCGSVVRWQAPVKGVPKRLPVRAGRFLNTLLPHMAWQENFYYKIRGQIETEGNRKILFFDLEEAVVTKGSRSNSAMYPAEWGMSFGCSLEKTAMKELMLEKEKDISRELGFLTVKTESPLSEEDQADIRIKTKEMLKHMKSGTREQDENYGA